MASYLPNLKTENISLYTIPVFWAITMSPRFYSMSTYKAKTNKRLDGRKPREWSQTIEDSPQLDITTKGQLRRAEAAVANGFENFGPYAAAMVAGSAAKLDPTFLNSIALGYLGLRVAYNWLYVTGETAGKAKMRALTYISGIGMLFSVFISAGNKLKGAAGL